MCLSIANIWVDNGGKFFAMQEFFKQKGTSYQHSCNYTAQQNGVVEHEHLPLCFRIECVSIAIYVINRFLHCSFLNKLLLNEFIENTHLILIFEF